MKLEYATETLGDDNAGDFILDDGGSHQRMVQVTPLAGGNTPFKAPRGNVTNRRAFDVSVEHENDEAAVSWFNDHPDALPGSGTLRITHGSYAAETAAVLETVERISLSGRSTIMRYVFICGPIITAA